MASAIASMSPDSSHHPQFFANGRYQVIRELGRGGIVLLARSVQIQRLVVIKVLTGTTHSAESLARFQREAQALAHLRHRNIVTVHEYGEENGQPFMVMA
jgi:eukaryotic-like serine/threonine-protein kinase